MSRADRMIARRTEASRKPRRREVITQSGGYRFVNLTTYAAQHKTSHPWWRSRYAEVVELRANGRVRENKPAKPAAPVLAPTNVPRPDGMSRQVYRKLCREARKTAARI